MKEKNWLKEAYPTFKNPLGLDKDFRPLPSLNAIISASHGPNWNISVPIE